VERKHNTQTRADGLH